MTVRSLDEYGRGEVDRCGDRVARMPKLPVVNGPELARRLRRLGFVVDHTTGSHFIMRHPKTHRRAVVPLHHRDLPRGTVVSILREAGIDRCEIV